VADVPPVEVPPETPPVEPPVADVPPEDTPIPDPGTDAPPDEVPPVEIPPVVDGPDNPPAEVPAEPADTGPDLSPPRAEPILPVAAVLEGDSVQEEFVESDEPATPPEPPPPPLTAEEMASEPMYLGDGLGDNMMGTTGPAEPVDTDPLAALVTMRSTPDFDGDEVEAPAVGEVTDEEVWAEIVLPNTVTPIFQLVAGKGHVMAEADTAALPDSSD
jgi:hypothetical protein